MCGIYGIVTFGRPIDPWFGEVRRAMTLMERRGPDSAGFWTDDEACALGFRRLAILDLGPTGEQPIVTGDGRYALVFNGELYNFRELRRSLETRGVRFRSTGDAEVVLHALAASGTAALETFNGMFALAFYDRVARRLLLARDHAGIKPLYLLRHHDGVMFASQYDLVMAHPWARERSVRPEALATYLHLGHIPAPQALLEGTEAIRPGCWCVVDGDGARTGGRYFEFPRFREPDLRGDDANQAVDAAIASAVRRQMVSDVPIGVFLSGGIDSPLVAAKMREAADVPAFTIGIGGDASDESPDAGRYAAALGLRHVVEQVTPDDALGLLDDVVSACNEPLDDPSIFPTAVVSRLARRHVKAVLSGDGGDDLFWGYPQRMALPLARDARSAAFRWRAALRRSNGTGLLGRLAGRRRFTGDEQLRLHRFVPLAALQAVFPALPSLPDDFAFYDFDDVEPDRIAQWMRWNEYSEHLVGILQKVDRASMHWSLEVRVPLLDREVLDVATRVDWRSCLDPERRLGKLPLRASLRRHVDFQTVAKRGFDVPMAAWLRGPLRPVFEDQVLARRDLLGLPLDQRALAALLSRHLDQREDLHWFLWRLLSLALWHERHGQPAVRHA